MKRKIIITTFILFCGVVFNYAYGQNIDTTKNKLATIRLYCGAPKVKNIAYFVNGYFFPNVMRINPDDIEKTKIIERDTIINGIKHYGQIFFTYKKKIKKPNFICLTELHKFYKEIKKCTTVYTIENNIIKDIDIKWIDKNNIKNITVSEIISKRENTKIQVVAIRVKEH